MAQGGSKIPSCSKCGRNHLGMCNDGSTDCFKCGQNGPFKRECPKTHQGNENQGNRAQSSSVSPPDRVVSIEATSRVGEGGNRLYDITRRQDQDDSLDIVTIMIHVTSQKLDPNCFSRKSPGAVDHDRVHELANAGNANAAPPVSDQEVCNAEFRNTIQLLAKSVANHNNKRVLVHANSNVWSAAARVRDFVRMNLPVFLGSQVGEDPQNIIDEVKKIFEVMHVAGNDGG
ncbi:hypothetical protein MTR67_038640 [Solanum verrucosum]|uniref:CCHC-type domain-containing protein n=1 Tax=Solanum verrucosum TaxID=315347 RepID=A0AAF0UGC6_SOLVR|nr:hypothetical protein MTR67_038640 [Solanum verrucosum]